MTTLIPVQEKSLVPSTPTADPFEALVEATLATVAPRSARVYKQTYLLWQTWCEQRRVDPMFLIAAVVKDFLAAQSVTQRTRQRQLSTLRKMARVLALDYSNPAWRSAYESLLLLRAPTEGASTEERVLRALTPTQVNRTLEGWLGDKLLPRRNQALIALLFLTDLRRSEAAALRWSDLDLEEGTLLVRHGKGDKTRTIAIAGELAIEALKVWKRVMGEERLYVFCSVGKGNRLGEDAPMTDKTVYDVVKRTEKISGVAFSPHDARRTLITEALSTGASLADVQDQAGHKNESTTLRYAKPVDARHRRERLRLRYGG